LRSLLFSSVTKCEQLSYWLIESRICWSQWFHCDCRSQQKTRLEMERMVGKTTWIMVMR